jgi:hypothetical protein
VRHFECRDLEPGAYVLYMDYEALAPRRVTVQAGASTHVDLTVSLSAVTATFAVTTPCKTLVLQTADAFHDRIRSGSCDRPTFAALAPGDYRVCADDRFAPFTVAPSPAEQHFTAP